MQELSDGDLLYMIHFDRNSWTKKWIQKAEREAQRRRLSLHVINDDYRAASIIKTIETQIDLPYSEPRSWQTKLFPWLTGGIVSLIYKMIDKGELKLHVIVLLFGLIVFDIYLWRHSRGSNILNSEPRSWQENLFPWVTSGIISLVYTMIVEWRFDLYLIVLLFGLLVFDIYLWNYLKGSNNPKEIFSGTKI